MKIYPYPLLIASATAATSSSLLYLLVPDALWTNSTLFSAAVLVFSSTVMIVFPFKSRVSTNLGIVGPAFVFGFIFLTTSALVLVVGLTSYSSHLDALNVGNVFIAVVGILILSASSKIIGSNQEATKKQSFHSFMSHDLIQLTEIYPASSPVSVRITKLVDELRFAPREPISDSSLEQQAALQKLTQLKEILKCSELESFDETFFELERLIRVANNSSRFNKSKV
jgi:hypothetical protein